MLEGTTPPEGAGSPQLLLMAKHGHHLASLLYVQPHLTSPVKS